MSREGGQRFLIIGLGNPGQKYRETRHNAGFMIVEALAEKLQWNWHRSLRSNALVAKGKLNDKAVHLLLPQTYMNLSGEAVVNYRRPLGVPPENMMVVVDDVAVPFGQMRIKPQGSGGGQRGLESVLFKLGTREVPRLRFGIGSPEVANQLLEQYVLEKFSGEERKYLPLLIERTVQALEIWLKEGLAAAMNFLNVKQEANREKQE